MRIFVAGGSGFLGRNFIEHFGGEHEIFAPTRNELDLMNADSVRTYLSRNDFDAVLYSVRTGGARDSPGMENVEEKNLRMFFNVAENIGSAKMLYFGSGAEYGKHRGLRKVPESEFGKVMPEDEYGRFKYKCAQYAQKSDSIYNLRLFGVFGKYEDYTFKFISNAIVKNLLGLPITINQDVVFDFLYVEDLLRIMEKFLRKSPHPHCINVTPTESTSLTSIAQTINSVSERQSETKVLNPGMNFEYTGDNSLLLNELGGFEFTSYEKSIRELYSYYESNLRELDLEKVRRDPYFSACKTRKP